jgi:U3 small nucleolar RNA-associated protein 4
MLAGCEPLSASTGASHLLFTPDSSKLVIGLTPRPYIMILDLSSASQDAQDIRLLRTFGHHISLRPGGRETRIIKGQDNLPSPLGSLADSDDESIYSGTRDADQPEWINTEAKVEGETRTRHSNPPFLTCLSVSSDGQWLATADSIGSVNIYNVDAVTVSDDARY